MQKNKGNKDSLKLLEKEIQKIDTQVKDYKTKYMKEHSETLLAKTFKTSQEPEIPEAPLLPNGKKDSTFLFRYYKAHYFDNFDFADDRMLRTPVFYNRMSFYLEKMTLQIPDSINKEVDMMIEKSKSNKEVFKYLVSNYTYTYETSKIMGFDAVFVHLVEKYYMTNQAFWVDTVDLYKINQRAIMLKPILIGKKAPNIVLQDYTNKPRSLYELKSPYTVLYFWDPDCSHCKKITPKLKTFYDNYKSKGVEVFAVNIEHETELWKKHIAENKFDWINVMDPSGQISFRVIYDIYSSPVIYLLDENKKILAKRVDVDQLQGLIDRMSKAK
jgi:thiol-disulfide isomerase/thioredoxin